MPSDICYNVVIPTPFPHWPARQHRSRRMLTWPPAEPLPSPAGPAVYSWLGLGFAASPPRRDSPSGRRPSQPGCLFTSAARGPALKCFPPATREARPGHTRFQVAGTRLFGPRTRPPGRAWPHRRALSLSPSAWFLSHAFWKQWRVPQSLPTAPPNAQMDVCDWKISLGTDAGLDSFLAAP